MLSDSQLATLAASIAATPSLAAYVAAGQDNAIADYYNEPSGFVVWRSSMSADEIIGATVWTESISRSQGERDCYRLLTDRGSVSPADPNIRAAFLDIFNGPGGAVSRTQLNARSQRLATKGEALFASGVGSTGDPGMLTFEGAISDYDVARALRP